MPPLRYRAATRPGGTLKDVAVAPMNCIVVEWTCHGNISYIYIYHIYIYHIYHIYIYNHKYHIYHNTYIYDMMYIYDMIYIYMI